MEELAEEEYQCHIERYSVLMPDEFKAGLIGVMQANL